MLTYLAEKSSAQEKLVDALGIGQKTRIANGFGYQTSNARFITARGHLLTPAPPKVYYGFDLKDKEHEYHHWDKSRLPVPCSPIRWIPIPEQRDRLEALVKIIKQATKLVIATDAGPEGELIAYSIINYANYTGPIERFWCAADDKKSIQQANQNLQPQSKTYGLYLATRARAEADWKIGMNLSPAASISLIPSVRPPFAIGRVLTPTLGLVVRRDLEIENFKPETYYEILGNVSVRTPQCSLWLRHSRPEEKRIKDITEAKDIETKARGFIGPLKVTRQKKSKEPPKLFNLAGLQQKANQLWGFSPSKTLEYAQTLYEQPLALITYPRTSGECLPTSMIPDVPQNLQNLSVINELKPHAANTQNSPIIRQGTKKTFDDKPFKTGDVDHYAIIPNINTNTPINIETLEPNLKKIYLLVATRYLAQFMPEYEYEATKIILDVHGHAFTATGSVPLKPGWKILYEKNADAAAEETDGEKKKENDDDEESDLKLPPIADGTTGTVVETKIEEKKTKPPPRFTEASLLKAMLNIADYVDDPKYKEILKNSKGIGTPATRNAIFDRLIDKYRYVEKRKNQLFSTQFGRQKIMAVATVDPLLTQPVMTAIWEMKCEQIRSSGTQPDEFNAHIDKYIAMTTTRFIQSVPLTGVTSPNTAGGKKGKGKNKSKSDFKPIAMPTNAIKLKVPYEKRQAAHSLGAKWNGEAKTWWIPPTQNQQPFKDLGFL